MVFVLCCRPDDAKVPAVVTPPPSLYLHEFFDDEERRAETFLKREREKE